MSVKIANTLRVLVRVLYYGESICTTGSPKVSLQYMYMPEHMGQI